MNTIRVDYQFVGINQLQPNTFNPKKDFNTDLENNARYQEVLKSVKNFGLEDAIVVRELEDGKYEIIDGFHRWSACKELGYTKVPINSLGKLISLELAKEILLSFGEAKIPVDPIQESNLLLKISQEISLEEMVKLLPYTRDTLETKMEIFKFNWDKTEKTATDIVQPKEGKEKTKTIDFHLTKAQLDIVRKTLDLTEKKSDEEAILEICEQYLV